MRETAATKNQPTAPQEVLAPHISKEQAAKIKQLEAASLQLSIVQYNYIGFFPESRYALLQWTKDHRVKLIEINPKDATFVKTVLDCTPLEISKITVSGAFMSIHTSGPMINLTFSDTAMSWLALGGTYGAIKAHELAQASGINWWTQSFENFGVKSNDLNLFGGKNSTLLVVLIISIPIILTFLYFIGAMLFGYSTDF